MRTIVTLLSNQDKTLYPHNTVSKFTNVLPNHIYPRRGFNSLYVRLLNVCIPINREIHKVAWIYLSEIEGSTLYRSNHDHCLGQLQADSRLATKDRIQFHECRHTSYHKINAIPLYRLNVFISDEEGNPINNNNEEEERDVRYAASITLEIMDEIDAGESFEIVGYSNNPLEGEGAFPFNTLTDFNIALPYEIVLDETWEVALAGMIFPPELVWSKYWVGIGNEYYYIDISRIKTRRELIHTLTETVNEANTDGNVKMMLKNDMGRIVLAISREGEEEESDDDAINLFHVTFSKGVMETLLPNSSFARLASFRVPIPLGRDRIIQLGNDSLDERVQINYYSPLALIQCNVVKPNIVGGSLKPLLQIIPMGDYIFADGMSYFQPHNLIYKDALNYKISHINIKLKNSLDQELPITSNNPHASISVMLKFRKKQDLETYQ